MIADPRRSVTAPQPTWRAELGALIRLSAPLALIHAGNQLLSLTHTALIGRLGEAPLAGAMLGATAYFVAGIAGSGVMLGLDPVTAQALGAGDYATAQAAQRQAPWLSLLTGLPLALVLLAYPLALEPMGITADVSRETSLYLYPRIPGLFALLLLTGMRSYLQASGRTLPLVISMFAAHAVNLPTSMLLIPSWGVAGAAWAGTLSTFAQAAILWLVAHEPSATASLHPRFDLMRRTLVLGLPIGLALGAEVGLFGVVSVLMGRLGASAAGGHQVALALASFSFNVTVGIGAGASVRVGHAVGRGDLPGTRRAGLAAMGLGLVVMGLSSIVLLACPSLLARLITDKQPIIRAAAPLIMIAGVFQLADGIQAIASGALRGTGRTRFPLVANLAGHYLLGLPVGVLASGPLHLGPVGLWIGLTVGLTAVAVALAARFVWLSRRPVARV